MSTAGLWLGVVGFGLWHGLNPAMGWPLAVARGLEQRRDGAVFATLGPLAAGHFLVMAVVLVPFALLAWLAEWGRAVRVGAGLLVLAFGLWRLLQRRHPRFLARVRPTQLAWWSFLMATAHGAGLMLVPIALGLCAAAAPAGDALAGAMRAGLGMALLVSAVHTLAMLAAGGAAAWSVYRWLGLRVLSRAWLDLDLLWGATLVATGAVSLALALGGSH